MEKSIVISKDFYSNCLIEAFKAKFKNWKNIKIIFIPRKYNHGNNFHVMWKNLTTNELFEFVHAGDKMPTMLQTFFEKGHILQTSWERHNRFIQIGVQKKVMAFEKKLEKKMDFVSMNVENQKFVDTYKWRGFENPDKDGFIVCMIDNVPKTFQVKDSQILDLTNNKVVEWDDINLTKWKYI